MSFPLPIFSLVRSSVLPIPRLKRFDLPLQKACPSHTSQTTHPLSFPLKACWGVLRHSFLLGQLDPDEREGGVGVRVDFFLLEKGGELSKPDLHLRSLAYQTVVWAQDFPFGAGVKGSAFAWCGVGGVRRIIHTSHPPLQGLHCSCPVPQTGLEVPLRTYSSIGCNLLPESVPRHYRGPDPPFSICNLRISQFHHKTILSVLSLCGVKSQCRCCEVKGMGPLSSEMDHNPALLAVPSPDRPDRRPPAWLWTPLVTVGLPLEAPPSRRQSRAAT